MEAFLSIIVYFIFIAIVLKIARKTNARVKEANKALNSQQQSNAYTKNAAQVNMANKTLKNTVENPVNKPVRRTNNNINEHMAKENIRSSLTDDRNNDWLAKQLRDERVAYTRMSSMFELKMEHRSSCEAEMIKRFHEDNCHANEVDTAEG